MTLNRNLGILKWIYFLDLGEVPEQTSLCALFWRTVFAFTVQPIMIMGTLPIAMVAMFLIALLGGMSEGDVQRLWRPWRWGAWLGRFLNLRLRSLNLPAPAEDSNIRAVGRIIGEGVLTVKGKMCPVVRFVEGD